MPKNRQTKEQILLEKLAKAIQVTMDSRKKYLDMAGTSLKDKEYTKATLAYRAAYKKEHQLYDAWEKEHINTQRAATVCMYLSEQKKVIAERLDEIVSDPNKITDCLCTPYMLYCFMRDIGVYGMSDFMYNVYNKKMHKLLRTQKKEKGKV